MEHNAEMLIKNNQAAALSPRAADKAAAERDIALVNKDNELRNIVDEAIDRVGRCQKCRKRAARPGSNTVVR